ncbi:hypothetical protein [Rugosimonospora acidiphila]
MSYEEKGVWTQLLSFACAYIAYLAVVVPRLVHTSVAHVSYVAPLVVTTVASILIATVVRSALEVARPSDSSKADVRDRDIARFGEHASRWCVIGGATAGIIGALDHWAYFWIANVIWLGFVLSAVVDSVIRLVAYRRGL